MYYCQNCGAEFERPARCREDVGEYMGRTAYQDFDACPSCGSEDIDEMKKCAICGEHVPEYKMAACVTRDVCEDCCRALEEVAAREQEIAMLRALIDEWGETA